MVLGDKKIAYSPLKNVTDEGLPQQRQEKLHRTKSQSLFFLVFFLLLTYLVLSVLLPDGNSWFSFYSDSSSSNKVVISKNELSTTARDSQQDFTSSSAETPDSPEYYTGTGGLGVVQTLDDSITDDTGDVKVVWVKPNITKTETTPPPPPERQACMIPKMDPMDPSIKHLIKKPKEVNCTDQYPLLFESYHNSTLVPLTDALRSEGYKACCYRTANRRNSTHKDPDSSYIKSSTCYPLSIENGTTITDPTHEFLIVYCKNSTMYEVVDMHIIVPEKESAEQRVKQYYQNLTESSSTGNSSKEIQDPTAFVEDDERVNVVILGIDAVSHMNFLRQFPESYAYLMKNLSAVEMQAYNKIGDNTYPNLAAALTSLNTTEMESCEKSKTYDNCPFVWKDYAAKGYRTSYGEDSTWMGIFNYLKRGFEKPPTDYYLRTYGNAADDLIGTNKRMNAKLCHGPRLSFRGLLGYMEKLAYRMGFHKRYFQLIWATSLTHDYLNDGHMGDKWLLSSLKWFHDEGYLDKTIYILMSDHGIRWGDIRDFLQGQLEERLPFLYFIMPQWFKEKYPRAYANLLTNRDRLSTPYDLHETLVDLLNLSSINSEVLQTREADLKSLVAKQKMPKGISQFLPIPLPRTCEMAGVEEHYCTCHKTQEIPNDHPLAVQAANYVVYFINLLVSKSTQCAYLALEKVKSAAVVSSQLKKDTWKSFTIILEARPGGGVFEASVEKDDKGFWKVSGTISRTNLYGNQSHCVQDKKLKLYCYCLDLISKTTSI